MGLLDLSIVELGRGTRQTDRGGWRDDRHWHSFHNALCLWMSGHNQQKTGVRMGSCVDPHFGMKNWLALDNIIRPVSKGNSETLGAGATVTDPTNTLDSK